MNMQIPSGLQALMQASQILQQQAAPTAPGPQGQQPTVASQVQQAAAQQAHQAQPSMQQIGQQAGIAGQLMAQRAQQAQNPQAVAQMAAQMLQQQGVASLPANMQFREGGIIGYNGERESEVDPEAGMSMAERADYQRRRKGSIYDTPEERARRMAEYDENPFASDVPLMDPKIRAMYEGLLEQQRAIRGTQYAAPEERQRVEQAREQLRYTPMSTFRERLQAGQDPTAGPDVTQAPPAKVERPELSPEERRRLSGVSSAPLRSGATPSPSQIEYAGPDERLAPNLTPVRPPVQGSGIAADETKPSATPRPSVAAPSAGIAAALKPVAAASVPAPSYPTATIPQEARGMMSEVRAAGENLLKAKQAQADLESEGIAALRRSENERKRLLESKRSRDSFNSLMALADSLYTRGNQYQAYKASVEAREEADRLASLAHDEAVIKLKQAKQAREMGNLELERNLKVDALTRFNEANKNAEDAAGKQATFASSVYSTQSHAAEQMANRANQINIELARMATEAERKKDADEIKRIEHLKTRLNALLIAIPRAQDQIASSLKKMAEFKSVESINNQISHGLKIDAKQQEILDKYALAKQNAEKDKLEPIQAQIRQLNKELGIEVPEINTSNLGAGFMDRINAELAARGKGKQ